MGTAGTEIAEEAFDIILIFKGIFKNGCFVANTLVGKSLPFMY